MAQDFSFLLRGLFFESPTILVWFAGLVVALMSLRSAPGPATLAFIACAIELLQSVGGNFVFYVLYKEDRISVGDIDIINLLRTILSAGAWLVILCAVFMWRKQMAAISSDHPFHGSPQQSNLPPGAFRR